MAKSALNELRRLYAGDALPAALEWALAQSRDDALPKAVAAAVRAADALARAVLDAERRDPVVRESVERAVADVARLTTAYDELCAARPNAWAPRPETPSKELQRRIVGALRRADAGMWLARFERAGRSSYLSGRSGNLPHRVNLAWLLQPDTCAKLDAGHFDDRRDAAAGRAAEAATEAMRLLQERGQ